MGRRVVSVSAWALTLCVSAVAEEPATRVSGPLAPPIPVASPPASPQAFGGELQETWVGGAQFIPSLSTYAYVGGYGYDIRPTGDGEQIWAAPLGLPTGSILEEIRLLVRDDDPVEDIFGRLVFQSQSVDGSGMCDGTFALSAWDSDSAGIDGRGFVVMAAPAPLTVRNRDIFPCAGEENHLQWNISVALQTTEQRFSGAIVRWRRSVSPAPGSATFGDVPTDHLFFQFIEALAASAITAGCGGGNYCPDDPVTRGQMAVFLAKALGLHWPI